MHTVGQIVPQLSKRLRVDAEQPGVLTFKQVDAEQREVLTLMRNEMLNNGRDTPLKTVWLNVIDQCLSNNPSPELILAAMKDVELLSPASSAKATGVSLL